ncbi:MAG TPA: DUF4124 domain-containing protein [Gammaproteobacteria bacterium]|nr:DUF4124 domain-containing protein [Gammaproteobacteria bacterium]
MNKTIVLSLLALALLATPLAAQVYRWVDENGKVHYTDSPPPSEDAKEAKLPDLPVVQSPPAPTIIRPDKPEPEPAGPVYPVLKIVSPAPEETVWADDGLLEITVIADPTLRKNHAFVYRLDGNIRFGPTHQYSVTLNEVYRGAHTVSVDVVNSLGEVIQASEPVTVYVKHHTILN